MVAQGETTESERIVGDVIREMDPYSLLARGAPANEFENEVAAVVARMNEIHSEKDATEVLADVFSKAFRPEDFPVESCARAGASLFARLVAAGLVLV